MLQATKVAILLLKRQRKQPKQEQGQAHDGLLPRLSPRFSVDGIPVRGGQNKMDDVLYVEECHAPYYCTSLVTTTN